MSDLLYRVEVVVRDEKSITKAAQLCEKEALKIRKENFLTSYK